MLCQAFSILKIFLLAPFLWPIVLFPQDKKKKGNEIADDDVVRISVSQKPSDSKTVY